MSRKDVYARTMSACGAGLIFVFVDNICQHLIANAPTMPVDIQRDLMLICATAAILSGIGWLHEQFVLPLREAFLRGVSYGQSHHHCDGCTCKKQSGGGGQIVQLPIAIYDADVRRPAVGERNLRVAPRRPSPRPRHRTDGR